MEGDLPGDAQGAQGYRPLELMQVNHIVLDTSSIAFIYYFLNKRTTPQSKMCPV